MSHDGEERAGEGPVLVLGASGFLGANLVMRLVGDRADRSGRTAPGPQARVVGACRRPKRVPQALAREAGCVWREVDLERVGVAADLVRDLRPQRVFLLAALSRMDACAEDPQRAGRINGDVPGEVADACLRTGARLVHISTDLVFGGAAPPGGYREDDPVGSVSIYGRTKAEGEARVLAADPGALVVRLPLLLGESFGRGWGASDGLLAALARGEVPLLFTDEWRTPLDAGEAARALVHLSGTAVSGLLHVAGPRRMSRFELGQLVLAAHGHPPDRVRPALRADVVGCADRPADVSLRCGRVLDLLPARLPPPALSLGLG